MTQAQVIKVFTPVKRVPTVIGKAQNGQKLPFGPYTLPQVAGVALGLLITSFLAMTLPANPAVTFLIGLAFTVVIGFGLGLIPYTGVRLSSRVVWVGRLVLSPKPVSVSGMPVTPESGRMTSFIEETVVVVLPEQSPAGRASSPKSQPVGSSFLELFERHRAPAAATAAAAVTAKALAPASSNWRAMTTGNGVKADGDRERSTNGERR
ncbi:hypothetical protein [Nocardia sp. NBC_01329]|uniref:hypothetical protein n=1 Tax=Nocardia sp. NBC_01329 TaxID=2903594 RepID=UPI002E125250|nr:hypothetical protein OG405_20185 [Nocardia sp. NBC_01329]